MNELKGIRSNWSRKQSMLVEYSKKLIEIQLKIKIVKSENATACSGYLHEKKEDDDHKSHVCSRRGEVVGSIYIACNKRKKSCQHLKMFLSQL